MTRRPKPPRIGFSTKPVAPPELGDAERVLSLHREASAMRPCAACAGTCFVQSAGGRRRACKACDGTGSPGVLAARVLRTWAPVCIATLARVIHHQRPALPMPGLDAGAGR